MVFLVLLGCSATERPEPGQSSDQGSESGSVAPYTGYPDSIAALGHSAVTGEGTQPGGMEVKANSWATGTNPDVKSVYLRILEKHPAIDGHAVNLGAGSADVTSLAEQARSLIAEDPQPQLVLVATLDADIQCPAGHADLDAYGRPQRGAVVPQELERLETAVAGFKKQVTVACARTERCSTDQTGKGWRMRAQYSDDLNHLNLEGQAKWAEHVWALLQEAQLVPEG